MIEHEEYCVSIHDVYKFGCKPVGYAVTLWRWSRYDRTWWYAGERECLFADCNGSRRRTLRQARRVARKLAGIFDCTNHDTDEEGMWQ